MRRVMRQRFVRKTGNEVGEREVSHKRPFLIHIVEETAYAQVESGLPLSIH